MTAMLMFCNEPKLKCVFIGSSPVHSNFGFLHVLLGFAAIEREKSARRMYLMINRW